MAFFLEQLFYIYNGQRCMHIINEISNQKIIVHGAFKYKNVPCF